MILLQLVKPEPNLNSLVSILLNLSAEVANGLVAMHTQWLKPKLTVLFLSHVISPYIHASRLLACSSSLLNSTHPGCLMLLNTVRRSLSPCTLNLVFCRVWVIPVNVKRRVVDECRLGAESSKIDEWNIAGDVRPHLYFSS
jgi:hypothetical protein